MPELVPSSPLPTPWWSHTGHRSLAAAIVAILLAAMSALVLAVPAARPADAAAPVDRRPVAANDPSELGWSGFLLSDPSRASGHYWAGAYATLAGEISYCVDEFYDYPRPSYGYRRVEAAQWAARRVGAAAVGPRAGHRIAWILNTVGRSRDRVTTTAVSMAVNLLTGSPTFAASYRRYLRPQLAVLDPRIVPLVSSLLTRSDLFAGPYTVRVTFGPAPAVGGVGQVRLSVRSANGTALRGARLQVRMLIGGVMIGQRLGRSGADGLVHVRYRVTRAGVVRLIADGVAPASSLTLGYSPSHSGPSYARGSQRVVTRSSSPQRAVAAGSGSVMVSAPVLGTVPVASASAQPSSAPPVAAPTSTPSESSAPSTAPVMPSPVVAGTAAPGAHSPTPPSPTPPSPTPPYPTPPHPTAPHPTESAPTALPSTSASGSVSSSPTPSSPSSAAPVTTSSPLAPSSAPVATAPAASSSSALPTAASSTSGPIIVVIRPTAVAPADAPGKSPVTSSRPTMTTGSPVRGASKLAATGTNLQALLAAIGSLGLGVVLLLLGRVARRQP